MSSSENYPKLTLEQIASGMLKCRVNAKELLADAEFLADGSRHARAYMLAHTACEELAKFFVLQLAGKRVSQANPPDWKPFWRRFRSHDSKMDQLILQLTKLQLEDVAVDKDLLAASETLFLCALQPRNASMYVDIGPDGGFRGPNDIEFDIPFPVLHSAANQALLLTSRSGETVTEIKASLREPTTTSERKSALAIMTAVLIRMRDAGVSKEEALVRLSKYWDPDRQAR